MNKYKYAGSCHCQNITFEMELTTQLDSYSPRACDCDFCIKQGATYISDKNGSLAISIKQAENLNRYHQGDQMADFLICKVCGILIGVCHESQKNLYATINSCTLDRKIDSQKNMVVSPKKFSNSEKIQRWKNVWFSNVILNK